MKTFDSLNLYALPTIKILTRWMDDDRLINKMVMQARADSQFAGKSHSEIVGFIITNIRDTIDVYRRLQKSFDEIDKTNAEYTAAVQKKVNYLSSSDKTIIGKIRIYFGQSSERN
ncbi:MAG: Wadjet anti-phage system protein JetA family protein [Bacilli bacterium]